MFEIPGGDLLSHATPGYGPGCNYYPNRKEGTLCIKRGKAIWCHVTGTLLRLGSDSEVLKALWSPDKARDTGSPQVLKTWHGEILSPRKDIC